MSRPKASDWASARAVWNLCDRFLEAAYVTFQELARMPGMGRIRSFPHARLDKLRSFRIKGFENYLIFYRPIQDGVEVFHVVHGARELELF